MNGGKSGDVPCERIIVRGVERRFVTCETPPGIRKGAFMPRKNGQDNDGLSVTGHREGVLHLLRRIVGDPGREGATLQTGRVRAIGAAGRHLDVRRDPRDSDPEHALIVGFPVRFPEIGIVELAICERLAELLAADARLL